MLFLDMPPLPPIMAQPVPIQAEALNWRPAEFKITLKATAKHPVPDRFILQSPDQSANANHKTQSSFKPIERVILPQWQFSPGPLNAITDVPGVKVGHVSITKDSPETIRTGVTAIIPHSDNLATTGLWAASSVLNGNGEMTGLAAIETSGILNTPILLTNTPSVGAVHTGVHQYFQKHYPGQWQGQLPVIAECYDGFFNTIESLNTIQPSDAIAALEQAKPGAVEQGRIGAGTGMRSFELHAGIGSASRTISLNGQNYTIGVLVNTNHGRLKSLHPQIRTVLESRLGPLETLREKDQQDQVKRHASQLPATSRQGSIIIVIATDLPLIPSELQQLAQRAGLGIGATGSTMDISSGDFALAFSTAHKIPLNSHPMPLSLNIAHPDTLSSVYRATVEAVTEAQLNALLMGHPH